MAKVERVECPVCGKVNAGSRTRCMYCEAGLAGASAATGEVPQYLKGGRRGVPWKLIFFLLVAGAVAAAYGTGQLQKLIDLVSSKVR